MKLFEVRKSYLDFFENKGHSIVPSSSLVPENDPSTLFTGSGMQPMVPYLLGETHPNGKRIADSQKCFRTQDIEEVGDNRHTTFFEMLGNWSLGDYFKKEQIPWIFEWLTDSLGLDPNRIYVTVFRGNDEIGIGRDSESVELWKEVFKQKGVEAKDVDFSERDGMNGGRIFYFDETKNWWSRSGVPQNMPVGEPGGPDSEMFWDFGEDLNFHEASQFSKNVCHVNCDCGRFIEIGNNVFMQYIKTDAGFDVLPNKNVDFGGGLERITAAVNDVPDIFEIDVFDEAKKIVNQRVVLDHLRAATFLMSDGIFPSNKDQGYFSRRLIRRAIRNGRKIGIEKSFAGNMGEIFIKEYQDVYPSLKLQEEKIISGLSQEEMKFGQTLEKGEKEFEKLFEKNGAISGEDAFVLFSTYGFPLELTEEVAEEKGQKIDSVVFSNEFEKHKDLSRTGAIQKFAGGLADHSDKTVRLHTATHLMLQALRNVLGDHVNQKGSNITAERLRFDFSHAEKMTDEQKQEVEKQVNEAIQSDYPVYFEMLTLKEARQQGATGVFDEKYVELGEKIKVYFVGNKSGQNFFSKEVCGGPHVVNTGSLGKFRIIKEESVAAGVRRIKAILE